MIRAWLTAAAIGGFLSVTAGSVAAHLATGDRTAELLRTGALYGMIHAAALIAVAAINEARVRPDLTLIIAGWSFTVGIILFSLSLFGLALTGIQSLGLITPFGGVGLLVGWAGLGMHAFRRVH
jgi:uncharacterized membrane protein YgdD (TMEM256/DUF423 family)